MNRFPQTEKPKIRIPRGIKLGGLALLALTVGSCSVNSFSETIESGQVGVLITKFGSNPGPQPTALTPGWHWVGIGESVVPFSVRIRTISLNGDHQLTFADSRGLPLSGDVQISVQAVSSKVPSLYSNYKLPLEELVSSQVYRDVQTAISRETEQLTTEDLYTSKRQQVVRNALAVLQKKWSPQGLNILQLEWLGPIRFPSSITESIVAKVGVDQATLRAEAELQRSQAEAAKVVAAARGEAESLRLTSESLRNSPEVLKLKQLEVQRAAIEKWDGHLPATMLNNQVPFLMTTPQN